MISYAPDPCASNPRALENGEIRKAIVGWRRWAVVRVLCMAAMLIVPVIIVPRVLDVVIPAESSPWHAGLVAGRNLIVAATMLWVYRLSVRFLEHRAANELCLRPMHAVVGTTIGAALISAVCGILFVTGNATFSTGNATATLGFAAAGAAGAALVEELVMRAILFRITEQSLGTTVALALSASVFGLVHGLNHGATITSVVAISLEAGVLLGLAYCLTRNLWLAVGIHLGWNFAEGSIYGAAVSGTSTSHALFRTTFAGPTWLTGGEFGPEASLISIAACLAVSGLFLVLVVRRQHWSAGNVRFWPRAC